MATEPSFADLLAQLRRRDNAAAAEVLRRYHHRLLGLARKQIHGPLGRKLDPEDVIQSVFRTVFRRLAIGQFDLGNWDGLWGLLTCVTIRKCGRWKEYFHTQAHDIRREVAPPPATDDSGAWGVFDREPGPEEAAALADTVQQTLKGLNAQEQQVVMLSLQGTEVGEVSRAVGYSKSKVYRVLRHVRQRLERFCDAPDNATGSDPNDGEPTEPHAGTGRT